MRAFATQAKATPAPGASFLVQRCSCGTPGHTGEMCEDCEKEKGGAAVQAKLIVGGTDDPAEREADAAARAVMGVGAPALSTGPVARVSRRAEAGAAGGQAPASVARTIATSGEPLPATERAFFEPRFGHDFGAVRVHRDADAAASARDVAARAYAVGHHLVFGAGSYAPASREGRSLIAHELAHVIQQTGRVQRHSLAPMPTGGPVGEEPEEEPLPEPVAEDEHEGGIAGVVRRFPQGEMFGDDPNYDIWPEKTEAARVRAEMKAAQECLKTVPPDPEERDPNRALTWNDFSGPVTPGSPFGAVCFSILKKRTTNTGLLKCMPFTSAAEKANPAGIQAFFDPTKSWVKPRSRNPTNNAVNGCQAIIDQCRADIAGGGTWALNTGPNAQCAASPSPRGDVASTPDECETVVGADCADQAAADSARLLAHEQGHYNLTFALAKKANKMITKTTDVDKLLTAANAVRVTQQALYDGQTGHGCNAGPQATWETAIAAELPAVTIVVP